MRRSPLPILIVAALGGAGCSSVEIPDVTARARRSATLVSPAVDWPRFAECFSGPGAPPPRLEHCPEADTDQDGDVDLRDVGAFLRSQPCPSRDDRPSGRVTTPPVP